MQNTMVVGRMGDGRWGKKMQNEVLGENYEKGEREK